MALDIRDIQFSILMTDIQKLFYTLIRLNKSWYANLIPYESLLYTQSVQFNNWKLTYCNINTLKLSFSEKYNDINYYLSFHRELLEITYRKYDKAYVDRSVILHIPTNKTMPKKCQKTIDYWHEHYIDWEFDKNTEKYIVNKVIKMLTFFHPDLVKHMVNYLKELYN